MKKIFILHAGCYLYFITPFCRLCKRIIPALYWPRYYSLPKAFTMIYIFNSGLWLWSNKQNGKQQSCGAWNMLKVFCKMYDVLSNILWNGKQSPRGYAFLLVLRCVLNVSEILTNCIKNNFRFDFMIFIWNTYLDIGENQRNFSSFSCCKSSKEIRARRITCTWES